MKKAKYSLFYIKILLCAYLYSISGSADNFLENLKILYEEAQVQENYYASMGVMNFEQYENPQDSKDLGCADQICYNHQSEIFCRSMREYLQAFIILYDELIGVTGVPFSQINAVQEALIYLLQQLGLAFNAAVDDVKMARENQAKNLIGSGEEFFSNLVQFRAEQEAVGNFFVECARNHNVFNQKNLTLDSLEDTISSIKFPKAALWAQILKSYGENFQVSMMHLRKPPEYNTYEPGLSFSKLRFAPAVVHDILSQLRGGSIQNLIAIPRLKTKLGALAKSPYREITENQTPKKILGLPRELVDLIEEFFVKITVKQKVDQALKQFTDVDREIVKLALGKNTTTNLADSRMFDDIITFIEKLGGKLVTTPFGSRFIIPNISLKNMTYKNSDNYFEFKMPPHGLLPSIKAILGPALKKSGWEDALLTVLGAEGEYFDNVINKVRSIEVLNYIDIKSMINIPENFVRISSEVVSQELFFKVLKNNPSIIHSKDISSYKKIDGCEILPDFPVNNIPFESTGKLDSVEEFLDALNSVLSQLGITNSFFRLPTPSEYFWASKLSDIETKNMGEYVATGSKENSQPHAVRAKRPNSKGFYSGGTLEWLAPESASNTAKLYGRSWKTIPRVSRRASTEYPYKTSYRAADVGFRVVLVTYQEISTLFKLSSQNK